MSLNQLLSIVKARWVLATSVFLFIVIVTLIVSLVFPKSYEAEAVVMLDVKSPDPINGIVLPGLMSPSYMASQVDILESERVARKVISSLGLDKNDQLREQWRDDTDGVGSFDAWLSERLQKNLQIRPSRESSSIVISYNAADPQFGALMANAFVKSYVDTHLELRIEPAKQFGALFEAQTKMLRDRLENAQSALTQYQRSKGLVATDERLDVENQRLSELSTQLVALQSMTSESISRQSQISPNSQEVLASPVVAGLRADMSRSEAKLKEMQAMWGEAHPQVVQLKANVAELKAKIEAETARVTTSVGINRNVSVSREGQIRAALDAQRTKVMKLKQERDEASVLFRDVENAQKAYDVSQARLYQTSLESQSNQTNISVLKYASPPTEHSFPKLGLNLALSIFLGGLIALGITLVREMLDRRMRTVDDINIGLGQPIIGVMPKSSTNSFNSNGKKRLLALKTPRGIPELAAPKA
jgi:polysaccharide biosynthesis transport protein